jgi:hypothetical protein
MQKQESLPNFPNMLEPNSIRLYSGETPYSENLEHFNNGSTDNHLNVPRSKRH